MSKKIFLSLLFVLALAVSCNKNNTTSPTTNKITFEDLKNEIAALNGLNIAEKGTITLSDISSATISANNIDIQANGGYAKPDDNTTTTDIAESKIQEKLKAIPNSKITYTIGLGSQPISETESDFFIDITPKNGEFDLDSFKKAGFTATDNTTASKISFIINMTLVNAKWTDFTPASK